MYLSNQKKSELLRGEIEIKNFNNDFLLLKSEDSEILMDLGDWIFKSEFSFVREVIVTEAEICIALNDSFIDQDIKKLRKASQLTTLMERKEIELPVYFADHEDWKGVTDFVGLSKEKFIERLLKTRLTAKMFGFLPGFLYMDGLSKELHVPRKSVPAKYVESNSIAIGGKYLGIYSLNSPGGWHVIGKTPKPVLDISKLPPVSYNIGDTVKIKAIGEEEYNLLKSANLK